MRRSEYGIVCGVFDPAEFNDESLEILLLRANLNCQHLIVGICRNPGATFDERVERVEALGRIDHTFYYQKTGDLLRELRRRQPHVRILESAWRGREAPGEGLADLRYYVDLRRPEILLPRMSTAA